MGARHEHPKMVRVKKEVAKKSPICSWTKYEELLQLGRTSFQDVSASWSLLLGFGFSIKYDRNKKYFCRQSLLKSIPRWCY